MAGQKQTWDSGGGKKLNTEECSQQEAKAKEVKEYILKIVKSVISKLEQTHDKSREVQLSKMKNMHAALTNPKKKLKIETLMKYKDVLKQLVEKVDKVDKEYFRAGTKQENTTGAGELTKTATRRDKSQSRVHHTLPKTGTENTSQNLQAGERNSSERNIANGETSPKNEWLPSHKSNKVLEKMLALDNLRNLYKCMDMKCYWSENDSHSFLYHLRSEHFNQKDSDWNHCCYCPFEGNGTTHDLVQHITRKHGYCQYQCAYCFFRGMACSYVIIHQEMLHTNKPVKVLQCTNLKVSPPSESELEPLASVVQPYICDQGSCGKVFYNPKYFLLHLQRQHNQVSTLTCHMCKATRLKAARLISHYKFHSLSLYQCRHCLYGAEEEEEILKHLCYLHYNLPALTVLRQFGPTKEFAPDADVNQIKILNLEHSECEDVISRPSESTPSAGGVTTSIQSEIRAKKGISDTNEVAHISLSKMAESGVTGAVQNASFEMVENQVTEAAKKNRSLPKFSCRSILKSSPSLQETNVKGEFSYSSHFRGQDAEKKDDNSDGAAYKDCQLAMMGKQCNHVTCKGSCKLGESQRGKDSSVKELKNSNCELMKGTLKQISSDSLILLTESPPEVTSKEERKLTQEHTTPEAFPVAKTKRFSTQIPILNAGSESNIGSECERNSCAESVNTNNNADKPQTITPSERSAVTQNSITRVDRQKQLMVSGLKGKDLYVCGNARCEYRAATKSQLQEHLYVCDLSREGVLRCRHCSRSFKTFNTLVNHLSIHGVPRYLCSLCTYCAAVPKAVEKHLKLQHKVCCSETVPVDRFLNNHETDMFIVYPQGKRKSKPKSTGHRVKSIYRPKEIHTLPKNAILKDPIKCSECSFKTKVCSNMKQHLALHLDSDVDPAKIPTMEVVKPVACLKRDEKMLDKKTNLPASSNVGVPKTISSGTSSSSGTAVTAGPTCGSSKNGKEAQEATPRLTSQMTKRATSPPSDTSIRDLSESLPSGSSGKGIQNGAQPTKRAAAVRASAFIRDLSVLDAAFVATYEPMQRAAALRARASIRDLSECVPSDSPISSPRDIEEPDIEKEQPFTPTPKEKKKPTSKEPKVQCMDCGTKCINVRGLKVHKGKNHMCPAKWLCGYCRKGGSTEMAVKLHCRVRHSGMPELVKYNEEATSFTGDDVRHRAMPELVKYNEEITSLELDNEFCKTSYGLSPKTVAIASSVSSPVSRPESLLKKTDKQTELPELLAAEEVRQCKRKSSQSTLISHHEGSHLNKEFSITERTAHYFECCQCSFAAFALQVLRKHFEMEHRACQFHYIVKPSKLRSDGSDNVFAEMETSATKRFSTSSTLSVAGNYICRLCSARTNSEEQFHRDHHSVHHPNVEPQYYFETVGHEAKRTKFECHSCCFTSDNFQILKEHLQCHTKSFQMWLLAQQCDLQSEVVRHQFSQVDSGVRESEVENWKKFIIQRNMEDESLCPAMPVSEKKDMQGIPCRIQNVAHKVTASSSVSCRLLIKSLSANKSEEDCEKSSESFDHNTEVTYSYYGQSPSPVDENRLQVFVNCGGSAIRISVSTFRKLHNIYPKVKVRDLKHEKLGPV